MTRRSRQRAGWTPKLKVEELEAVSDPFVVRFGPWARNFYIGLPAALALGMVGWAAQMQGALAIVWYGIVAWLAIFCAVPRETRFYADGSVVVSRKLFALVPLTWRRYARAEVDRVESFSDTFRRSEDADHSVTTIWLCLKGRKVAVQSYSSGADNSPPPELLRRILREKFGLLTD